jgi:hypothetical protein
MDATGLLAPLLVLTTVVERVMEAGWGVWERAVALAFEARIRLGNNQAEKDKLARDPNYARKTLFENDGYTQRKRIMTMIIGSLLGLLLSALTGMRFFEMTFAVLQIPQPVANLGARNLAPIFDVIITGLIVGAGSQPVHALINWITFAQSVQKELVGLRKGERMLSDSRLLNEVLATLGVPPESISDVLKLMEQYNIRTLDDLLQKLRGARSGVSANDIAAAENVQAVKSYLVMIGRGDLLRMMP